jgi:hypothetical protein
MIFLCWHSGQEEVLINAQRFTPAPYSIGIMRGILHGKN